MTHFRGQIRGPHWGPTMDNMLIDFWRRHECLFNSSADSYYDKDVKTKLWTEFALSIGKSVSDVERRSRSLRTQYGRVLWHPEKVNTVQQKMLREKLDFLRPYIVRRRGETCLEEKCNDQEEDDKELETEECVDPEMGSSLGSPLDADVTGQDLDDELQPLGSIPNLASLHCSNPQTQVTEVKSISCPQCHDGEDSPDQPETAALDTSKHDILNQFMEVMMSDMRQIKDPMVLMRLRRDITDLVFKAVEEDTRRRYIRVPSTAMMGDSTQSDSCPQELRSLTNISWRQRSLKRKNQVCETERRMQKWEEMKHIRKMASQLVQQGQTVQRMSENGCQVPIQDLEIKRETEPHVVKTEEEPFSVA
ncbi:uncharacterized protein LOC111564380 isoform X1 [Amphiprion ocellaris]|uniref:uncharacterized protein LOC111564380 isoform X1 n=1 Tax=Amphiprion ocellaris TaxID=80972 RepID=UPI000C313687|nr:uncharacterized protein LOC111564380 isoform X1 [Amphiprion ocellaris]